MLLEPTIPHLGILVRVVIGRGRLDKGLVPLSPLFRLNPVIIANFHQLALFYEDSEFGLNAIAECPDIAFEVGQQKVCDRLVVGADTCVDTRAAGKSIDQEYQAGDTLT